MKILKIFAPLAALAVISALTVGYVYADDDDYRERGERYERGQNVERGDRGGWQASPSAPEPQLYKDECSSCHLLYKPWLLPARSWARMLNDPSGHFGEDLALDGTAKKEILSYLVSNAADTGKARNEWAGKIARSVGSGLPVRITDVPYIRQKHREIRKEVFTRDSVKSFSNCAACHRRADAGDFEEDFVKIPR